MDNIQQYRHGSNIPTTLDASGTMNPTAQISILVGDDHQIIFSGLSDLLGELTSISRFDYASSIPEIRDKLSNSSYTLLLLDLNINGINSLDYVGQFKSLCPNLKVIIFSSYNNPKLRAKAEELDADAYLSKSSDGQTIRDVITRVTNGESWFESEQDIATHVGDDFIESAKLADLSKREKQVVGLVLSGHNESEIAEELFVSKNTVRTHKKNIFQKLDVSGVSGLLKYLQASGEEF